jgi:hypothetical protein
VSYPLPLAPSHTPIPLVMLRNTSEADTSKMYQEASEIRKSFARKGYIFLPPVAKRLRYVRSKEDVKALLR